MTQIKIFLKKTTFFFVILWMLSISSSGLSQDISWKKVDEGLWVKASSLAVLGMDKNGNGLFIFSEAPYSGHDFINLLLSLPISLYSAMYLEGGSETSLYLSSNGIELDKVGIKGPGLDDSLVRGGARPIPNVIGITKKTK